MIPTIAQLPLARNCLTGSGGLIQTSSGSWAARGGPATKRSGAGGVGGGENLLPLPDHLRRAAEVNLLGREQADAAVAVLGVVPGEERAAERLRLLDVREPAGEARLRRTPGEYSNGALAA